MAFTGVDGTTSILLRAAGGAHAVLTCTSAAVSPTTAAIVGTDARVEIPSRWYGPNPLHVFPRNGEPRVIETPSTGHGLHYEADEVARCLEAGLLESPLLPLDETVAIMETMDAILQAV